MATARFRGESVVLEGQTLSDDDNKTGMGGYIALGTGMGVALGVAFGATFGNVPMGAALGPTIGAGISIALWAAIGGHA